MAEADHGCETCSAIDEIIAAARVEGTDGQVPVLSEKAKELLLGLLRAQRMFG